MIAGGFRFQPSELVKVFTILMLARWCRRGRPLERTRDWLPPIMIAALPAVLIVLQPDLGTALLFIPVGLAVVFVSGMPPRALAFLAAVALLLGGLAWEFVLADYQKERIWSTYNLDRMTAAQRAGPGYQLEQSLLAIGNGGLFGWGHGEGPRIQSGKLPYQYNDFIFAVAAEEHGFAGGLILLILYCVLVVAVLRIAHSGRDPAGRVLCLGVGMLIGSQALVHMAVTLGLAPTKGLPLPLVSAGGTSLLSSLCALALVENVAINRPLVPIVGLAPRGNR
jgi:rod shape determining protein RodA